MNWDDSFFGGLFGRWKGKKAHRGRENDLCVREKIILWGSYTHYCLSVCLISYFQEVFPNTHSLKLIARQEQKSYKWVSVKLTSRAGWGPFWTPPATSHGVIANLYDWKTYLNFHGTTGSPGGSRHPPSPKRGKERIKINSFQFLLGWRLPPGYFAVPWKLRYVFQSWKLVITPGKKSGDVYKSPQPALLPLFYEIFPAIIPNIWIFRYPDYFQADFFVLWLNIFQMRFLI